MDQCCTYRNNIGIIAIVFQRGYYVLTLKGIYKVLNVYVMRVSLIGAPHVHSVRIRISKRSIVIIVNMKISFVYMDQCCTYRNNIVIITILSPKPNSTIISPIFITIISNRDIIAIIWKLSPCCGYITL
jgi:hypothetical protein